MRKSMRTNVFVFAVLLIMACVAGFQGNVFAYDVNIHGYGDQNYIDSNKNDYLGAEEGTWEKRSMSLIFDAEVLDNMTIWTKIFFSDEEFAVEWMYAELNLGYDIHVRGGQMKFPVGFENLIRDNKFLHLGVLDSQMYSEVDFIHETFLGVDLEYNGPVTLEVLYGAPEVEEEEGVDVEVKNLVGGRILYETPLEGLSAMVSGSSFSEEVFDDQGNAITDEGHETVWVAGLRYEHHNIDFMAEYGRKDGIDEDMESYYAQLGYTLFGNLTPYARYDYIATDIDEKDEDFGHQTDIVVGIGYKINRHLKFKVEEHFINGYGLAVESGEVDPADPGAEENWSMFAAGINFIF